MGLAGECARSSMLYRQKRRVGFFVEKVIGMAGQSFKVM